MAPGAGGKRKRPERSWSDNSGTEPAQRPSPHRPSNLNMAQNPPQQHRDHLEPGPRGRGRRQSGRGGRSGGSSRRPSSDGQKDNAATSPANPTSTKETSDPIQTNGNIVGAVGNQQVQPRPSPSPAPPTDSSQQTQSQPQLSSQPEPAPAAQPVPGPPMPYDYEYVTDSVLEGWMAGGRQKLVEDGVEAKNQQDAAKLAALYQELIRSAIYGRLPPTDSGAVVKDIIGEEVAAQDIDMEGENPTPLLDIRALFLDTLSIVTDSDTSNSALKPLVFSTGINASLMRLQLDTPLLQSLGLVRDTFARMGIRKQTNLLYRQSNYNLLREESEGYSKLLTELFTTSNNEPPSSEVVEDTFERVKAMIGAFDMDVGRVLDVTLDVFAAVLVKQYRFFVKLLRVSSWWPKEDTFRTVEGSNRDSGLPNWALPGSTGWVTTDEERADMMQANAQRDQDFWKRVREIGIRAFFEIGRKPLSQEEKNHILPETSALSEEEDEVRKWVEETGTLPPKGSRVAAQLLGFKLRFYSSRARSKLDVLPDNLIYLAALLIKVGFISLRDLYPHLWRPDDSMDALKDEKLKEKEERERAARPGGGINALMMAGALSDDTLPAPRVRETEARATPGKEDGDKAAAAAKAEEEELPEPSDQKVLLLKSLLAIGALPESLFILSKFPWLMDVYPELPEFIHRVLHQCLSKVYSSLRPLPSVDGLRDQQQIAHVDQSSGRGQIRLSQAPPRRVLRWAQLDVEDTNDGIDYRFYWDDWADNVPVCQSVDDVFALCSSFLNLSGHKIGQDASLLSKLARIGKDSLTKDGSQENRARWQDLCKRLLVPSISLTKANPGVVNEIFDLISFFSREIRYNMYAEWNFGQTSRLPDIKSAFDQARAETKDVLKRLSKTNIRPMARALAKIAYANPGIVINVAISQIESYENLIEVVVECARYFTYLGYDILTWELINSLGQKGRSRVQEGGLLTSRWLNALATFAGRTFKRYSVMDPTPVLQYVVEQLRHNNSTDLIVLEQVISSMAGIITDTNFNDAQIQAMAGGEMLQSQTILQLLDKRHESKTTSKRLLKSLTVSKLAGQLLVAIAQERLTCIFRESEEGSSELKLLGNIVDEIHRILTQYVDLLRSNMTTEEFDSFVPDLPSLIKDFGIQPEIAFWIQRPSVGKKIADVERVIQEEEAAAKSRESEVASTTKPDEGQPEMAVDGEPTPDGMDVDKPQVENANESDSTTPATEQQAVTSQGAVGSFASNAVVQDLEEQIKAVLPTDTYGIVGLRFYVVFWQLSLYDVHVPQKAYEDEIERQKKKVVSINNDRSDISMAGTHRKEREKKQITQLQERILEENKTHLKAYGQTRTRLQKEKDRWFAGMRGNYDSLNVSLLEQCFLPRLLLSPIEAFYCFKVLKFLHASGTPNFRTVGLLDQLFREQRITALIFQCTSKEADNFGHFLNETLRDLGRWHADKAVYEKEAFGTKRDLPGFATIVDPEGKPTTFLEYEDFRRLLYKWHRLLASALKICLNGGEYMHIRNAISVLKAIVQQFPAVNWIGRDMLTSVNNLSHNDERDDVKTPAASLIGDLNRREKKWMLPQAFNEIKGPVAAAANQAPKNESSPSDKTAAGASRPQSATPAQLNASAPTFKPSDAQESEGAAKPETTKAEVEDGEIEDAKMTDVAMKGMDEASQLQEPSGKVETEAEAGSEKGQEQPLSDKPAAESASESTSRAQPSPGPAASQPETQPSGQGRQAEPPKRPEPERAPASSSSSRSLPNRPSRQGDGRLPARPDFPNDRRPRHPEYPRGGRYDGEHDYGRPFEGDGRNYGPLDRELVTRPPPDDSFRGPGYRDGRLPREPDWPDRPGRVRAPPDVFLGRPDAIREAPSGPRPGPLTHPDRAELIHDRPERDRRGMPPRALSPPRPTDLPVRPERFPPDDRRFANYPPPPSRHDDMPTGPRSERLGRGEVLEPREPPTGPEMSHGRLRQQEPPADTPSGPRVRNAGGRSGRGASSTTAAQPPSQPAAGGTERQPPSGPGRQGARGSQAEQGAAGGPQSPNSDRLDNSGIHPDRLKALQKQGNDGTYSGARPQQPPSPGTIAPPSGPRSGFAPPAGLPSMPRAAPAPGPSMGGERGRGDKRFAGINTMLQQSAGPTDRSGTGTTIRGRGANRAAAANAPSPQSTRPQTPSGTPDDGSRAGAPQQGRPDLLADRISNAPRPDEGLSRSRHGSGRGDLLEDPGSEPRRSVRNSSSTHERERDRERERERDRDRDRDRDHRDRSERERERDRDRDRERDRRGDDEGTTRSNSRREERAREYDRERSRRSDAEPPREVLRRGGGSGARDDTRRRERRERDDGSDMASSGSHEHEGRLRPPSSMGAPPPPPPPPPPLPGSAEDERRWSGGRERERERNRDRGRDRDYHRDGGGGGGGGSGGGHRKRGRTGEDGGAQGEAGREGGGRGGGMRMGSESKRPRRGM